MLKTFLLFYATGGESVLGEFRKTAALERCSTQRKRWGYRKKTPGMKWNDGFKEKHLKERGCSGKRRG